jgi:hypothetical protein
MIFLTLLGAFVNNHSIHNWHIDLRSQVLLKGSELLLNLIMIATKLSS